MSNIAISERRQWVGSSESAILLGVSTFGTLFELYHEKTGRLGDVEMEGERIDAGRFLEPAIAAWASHKWGWALEKVTEYAPHPTVPGMGASLDFATGDGEPVEIKNVDFLVFRDQWVAEGDVILDAPIQYLVQVQHQLACRPGVEGGWLVACVAGNRLLRMRVKRHAGTIQRIEQAVTDFWRRVDEGRAPTPDFEADAATIAALYASTVEGKVIDLTTHNRIGALVAEYQDAHEVEKGGKDRKAAAKAEMLTILDDASGAICPGGIRINAKTIQRKGYTVEPTSYRDFRISQKKDKAA